MADGRHQQAILLCGPDEQVQDELEFSLFEQILAGDVLLEGNAASQLRGCYCVVGSGLQLHGAVFFLVQIDEHGVADHTFNLPLHYLAQQAGCGGDLGEGPVKVACRGNCSVPWHSLNLWQPSDMDAMLTTLQQSLYRNRLKLKMVVEDGVEFDRQDALTLNETDASLLDEDAGQLVSNGEHFSQFAAASPTLAKEPGRAQQASKTDQLQQRLEEVFGVSGKLNLQDLIRLHSDQLNEAKQSYRDDLDVQQRQYLDQLRVCRDEIRELKVALRQEQSRNRRLQAMLRGEP